MKAPDQMSKGLVKIKAIYKENNDENANLGNVL